MEGGDAAPSEVGVQGAVLGRAVYVGAEGAEGMSACVGHDPRICEVSEDLERRQRYELRLGGPWRAVSRAEWVNAERVAGFHNTMGHPDRPATGGFSGHGIEGRIRPASGERIEGTPSS